MSHIELSGRAEHDLRRIGRGAVRDRIIRTLAESLAVDPPPANLDIKALQGAAPWLRMRIGEHRILYRPLTAEEMQALTERAARTGDPLPEARGFLVARIVHRGQLERAISSLR